MECLKSYEKVGNMIECCSIKLDHNWRHRLLKKHKNLEDLIREASICFGGDGHLIAH